MSGYLAVILAAACWGTSGIFAGFILDGSAFSPLSLAFWRDLFTFLTLFAGLRIFRPAWLRAQKRDLPWLAAVGISVGAFHVFWNLAVLLNGAAVATVQQSVMPAIVAVAAWLLWQESLGWRKTLAIILTFAGTVLVSGIGLFSQTEFKLFGLLAGLGLPIAYASWNLFSKKISDRYKPLTILTYAFAFGALALLPFQFFIIPPWSAPPAIWLLFVGMIFLPTIGGWYAYMLGLARLPVSVAGIIAMAEIPFVAVYAYFFLGELMTAAQAVGAALVIGGVTLLILRKKVVVEK